MKPQTRKSHGYPLTIYVGDYSVVLWVPAPGKEKETVQKALQEAAGIFGMKVVEA